MNMHKNHKSLRSAGLLLGMALALPLSLHVPQANATIAQQPLFLTNPVAPLAILNMSRSHQLFYKAYNDYSDLNGDGVPELTYEHNIDYYGYFDSYKCYTYSTTNTRFAPSSKTANKYCEGTANGWSGNFLNWVAMSRMDVVRKLLYGGKRIIDTDTLTVLERAFLPNDAHSWAKYYNGVDIEKLTPFDPIITPVSVTSSSKRDFPTSFPDDGGRANFIKFYISDTSEFNPGDQVRVERGALATEYLVGGIREVGSDDNGKYIELRVDEGSVFGSGEYDNWKLINLSSTGISFCNTTYASSGDSQDITAPPLMRVVAGNFALWSANESTQCLWFDTRNNRQSSFPGGFRSNGNRAAFSGLNASAENPDDEAHGLGEADYVVQVEVCVTGKIGEEDCKKYPDGNYKPIGLLQEFGDEGQIDFGLFTGSYNKNISGGVLRKNVSAFSNEVNVDTNGTFTDVDGIVSNLDNLRIYGYRYGVGDHYGEGDNCSYQLTDITEGDCRSWGNPMSEMYVESLRYLAGKNATDAFTPSSTVLGLTVATWEDPLNEKNYCAPLNVLNFNASVSSYDNDQMGVFSDLGASKSATELTNELGELEDINGKNWFVGNTTSKSNDLCSAKTVTGLGNIAGICPEAPAVEGTYKMAGAAWYANTNKIRNDIAIPVEANDETKAAALKVTTYGVALAANVPKVAIPVPNSDKVVTILPAYRLDVSSDGNGPFGAGGLVDFKIVDSYTVENGVGTGRFYVNWEDSEQGGDYDQDMWGVITYKITETEIEVATNAVSASTDNGQGFGYVISGTTEDGPHFHSGIYDFDYTDPHDISVTPTTNLNASGGCDNCQLSDSTTTATYQIGDTSAGLLKDPLWYTAKYGGFDDTNNNGKPDLATEWDEDGDGSPDTFFYATNPLELEASLRQAFLGVLGEEASASSVATNSTRLDTNTVIYQARFESEDWSGQLLAYDLDPTDGSVGNVLWDASKLMPTPAARNIFTWNPDAAPSPTGTDFLWGQLTNEQQKALNTAPDGTIDTLGEERLKWIRGDGSNEIANGGVLRNRHVRDGDRVILGDIVNSDPFFVGSPDYRYGVLPNGDENVYDTFLANIKDRTPVIYIGANDGMLHAFNANTGVEMFAYIPSILFKKLSALPAPSYADDDAGKHNYYVDATARAGDAFFSGLWHTVLVGGLGAGGRSIFALDITHPDSFDETDIMWEFTPAVEAVSSHSEADAGDLGYTIGQPTIARLANDKWVAMFGNGYASPNGDAILYILNLETGKIIRKITAGGDTTNNGLSTVIPVDVNSDRITDYVYAGDLQGNMWKFDLTNKDSSKWDVAWTDNKGDYPLFKASGPSGETQPITHRPQVGFGPGGEGGYMVYFGTGKYFETTDNDVPTAPAVYDVQSFYGIHDKTRDKQAIDIVPTRSDLVEQTIIFEGAPDVQVGTGIDANIRVVSDNKVDYSINDGWYIDLVYDGEKQGERVVANPLLRSNRIIFTTLIPTTSPCGFGGTGWLMEMDAFSGGRLSESVFDLNDDDAFTDDDYVTVTLDDGTTIRVPASGMQSQVGIIKTPGIVSAGDMEYKYLSGSSGEIEVIKEKSSSSGGRKSWRQIR